MIAALGCLLAFAPAVGTATTFSRHDRGNPNPRVACGGAMLRDSELVAAHPRLPCGTRVLVCAPRTRRCVTVRVVDRGPAHALIDLSLAATRALRSNGRERVWLWRLKDRRRRERTS